MAAGGVSGLRLTVRHQSMHNQLNGVRGSCCRCANARLAVPGGSTLVTIGASSSNKPASKAECRIAQLSIQGIGNKLQASTCSPLGRGTCSLTPRYNNTNC
jgi:hypothetical protein